MKPEELKFNLSNVKSRIRAAEAAAGRPAGDVKLLAISKTQPINLVRMASKCGLTAFGENYAQDLQQKLSKLKDLPLEWHFVGLIQANKSRLIAESCDWVHSVDRIKIAKRLSEQRPRHKTPLQILLQVNISNEASKSGAQPEEIAELADAVSILPHLKLRGLMSIPSPNNDQQAQRQSFYQVRMLYEDLSERISGLDTLSMGMSADLEAAILEGSTLVRVGTDIFGPRYT